MRALGFLLLFALGVPSALAIDPCLEDVKRLCPGVALTKGAVRSCLQKNEAALGETCRATLDAENAAARRFVREFLVACKADLDQFCPAIEPGGGRMLGCLSRHQLEILAPLRVRGGAHRRGAGPGGGLPERLRRRISRPSAPACPRRPGRCSSAWRRTGSASRRCAARPTSAWSPRPLRSSSTSTT